MRDAADDKPATTPAITPDRETPPGGIATSLTPDTATPAIPALRVMVAGIGYRNLRDHSVGLVVMERLGGRPWPKDIDVVVEDLSYNPVAVSQRFDSEPPGHRFSRLVVVSGVARGGARWPGAITCYRWDGVLPPDREIRRAMTVAMSGTISIDNTLIVAKHVGSLPDEVIVVEVEPAIQEFGDHFSTPVTVVVDELTERVATLAVDEQAIARLPVAALGGGVPLRGSRPT